MDPTLRALNGFGLGARIGERQRVREPRDWLLSQLEGEPSVLAAPPGASPEQIAEAVRGMRALAGASQEARRAARQALVTVALAESRAALDARVASERPFVERLSAFWSNHLCVSAGAKVVVAPLAGSYEREAIRPHVLGRFEDLVLASARHPAMLLYLDNAQSVGPGSTAARAGARRGTARGLNENYARELLELHTLGVDGGYDQRDVQALARMLTGWTIEGLADGQRGRLGALRRGGRGRGAPLAQPADSGSGARFVFREAFHEPGSKTLLGDTYGEAGETEAARAIRTLCRHPSTARFIASKLVTHFVADTPPPAAVDRLADVFRDTGGDLLAVSRALVALPEAWDGSARKFRSPQDWLVAALRALGSDEAGERTVALLRQLRQPLWAPQSPKGFGDAVADWADPDALLNRAELSRTLARTLSRTLSQTPSRRPSRTLAQTPARRRAGRVADPRALLDVMDVAAQDPLRAMLADEGTPRDERIALALAGPAFQWR